MIAGTDEDGRQIFCSWDIFVSPVADFCSPKHLANGFARDAGVEALSPNQGSHMTQAWLAV